jgi:hypothetical protein
MARGRTVRTAKNRKRFLAVIAEGASVSAAYKSAGISREAVYAWRRDDPKFREDWDGAFEEGTDKFEDQLRVLAADKNLAAIQFALRARRPERYDRQRLGVEDIPMNPTASSLAIEAQTGRRIYLPASDLDQPLIEGTAIEVEKAA